MIDVKTKLFHLMAYRDLENLAKETYKLEDYEFVAIEECSNDSSHTFHVDGKIDKFDLEDAANIRTGTKVEMYRNYLVLACLCADGIIPPGDYIIDVCW